MIWSSLYNIGSGKEKWQIHSKIKIGQGKISSLDIQNGKIQFFRDACIKQDQSQYLLLGQICSSLGRHIA